jgi:zinc protease
MKALAITQETLDNQREAVKEERRLRVDNQPYGKTSEVMSDLAFENFVNKHSVIGSMTDLDAATIADVTAFFKTYYAPNNAVIAIAGDVDANVALEKVRKYFESIPQGAPPPKVDAREPPQKGERRVTIEDPLARLTLVDTAYHIPGGLTPDMDALGALASILGSGRSSRLYEGLVRQQQIAVQVYASASAAKGPGLFYLEAIGSPGRPVPEVEAAMYAEVEKIKSGPIQEWELEKARNASRRSLVNNLRNSLQRAILLSRYAVFYDDPEVINSRYERIASVKIEDVQRVARQYLVPENRTVVITTPPKPGAPGAKPGGAQ